MWPFTRRNPVHELIQELNFVDPALLKLEKEIDVFERANPLVGALGDAVGFVGFGGKNFALQAQLQHLDQLKSALAEARELQRKRRDGAAARLDELATGDPSGAVRRAARIALDKTRRPAHGSEAKRQIAEDDHEIFAEGDTEMESAKTLFREDIYSHDVGKIQSALSRYPGLIRARYNNKKTRYYPKYQDLTPLHLAANKRNTEVTEILLRSGADPNSRDEKGQTPLHLTESPEVARLLVKHGAKINLRDKDGETPLKRALGQCIQGYGHVDTRVADYVEALIRLGADARIPDNKGETSLQHIQRGMVTNPHPVLKKIADLIAGK
jgi:hypothetical protein